MFNIFLPYKTGISVTHCEILSNWWNFSFTTAAIPMSLDLNVYCLFSNILIKA